MNAANYNLPDATCLIISWFRSDQSGFHAEQCPNISQFEHLMAALASTVDGLIREQRNEKINDDQIELDNLIARLDDLRAKNLQHQWLPALYLTLHPHLSPSHIPVRRALRRSWQWVSLRLGDNPLHYVWYLCSIQATMKYFCTSKAHPDYISEDMVLEKLKVDFRLVHVWDRLMSPDTSAYHKAVIKLTQAIDSSVEFKYEGIDISHSFSHNGYMWGNINHIERFLLSLQQTSGISAGKIPDRLLPFNHEQATFFQRIKAINLRADSHRSKDGTMISTSNAMFHSRPRHWGPTGGTMRDPRGRPPRRRPPL